MKRQIKHIIALVLFSILNLQPLTINAQDTVFTYQGQVMANGTNFTGTGQFKFALVTSTNTSSQATATADPPSNGYITGYMVTAGGSGYLTPPTVTVSGGGGSGAQATAQISSAGVVTNLAVVSFGNGNYSSAPTVIIGPPTPAIADTTYWSNDGTSSAGSEPTSAVSLTVANGLFTVVLGNSSLSNMTAISAALFEQTNLQLQIWFNDGSNGFAALNPPQPLTPTPYATFASTAGSAASANSIAATNITGSIPLDQLPAGLVTNTQTGVTVSGTFNGNGGGLTNLNAANLTGSNALPVGVLPANVAFLNSNQTFAGVNVFNSNVGLGIAVPFRTFQVRPAANRILGIFAGSANGGLSETSGMTIESVNDADTVNLPLEFRGSPNVFTTGNVGIGTTNPLSALDVNGSVTATNLTLKGTLNLPATTDTIYSGSSLLLRADGNQNFFAGQGAGNLTLTSSYNTGIGDGALGVVAGGGGNTALGSAALANNTGSINTAVGFRALINTSTGSGNTGLGNTALFYNTTGNNNTATGSTAMQGNTTGTNNTATGYQALRNNTAGNENTATGDSALCTNTTGINNTANGAYALYNNTTANNNTAIGYYALQANTIGTQNTANGVQALQNNTSGNYNTADGCESLQNNTNGSYNTANGWQALSFNTSGTYNTANGVGALQSNTTGSQNAANGVNALLSNTTGNQNTANGVNALFNSTTASNNTANGFQSLVSNTTGSGNTASGEAALNQNTTGNDNIAEGYQAGYNITTGSSNIDIGNLGLASDSNIIRIGTGQTQTFIAGVLTGNGSGLTNLNASQLPSVVLTNNANGVSLNGTFTGNGAGLTNVTANAFVGGLTTNFLVLVPGGGTNTLCFTNGILMAIQ